MDWLRVSPENVGRQGQGHAAPGQDTAAKDALLQLQVLQDTHGETTLLFLMA